MKINSNFLTEIAERHWIYLQDKDRSILSTATIRGLSRDEKKPISRFEVNKIRQALFVKTTECLLSAYVLSGICRKLSRKGIRVLRDFLYRSSLTAVRNPHRTFPVWKKAANHLREAHISEIPVDWGKAGHLVPPFLRKPFGWCGEEAKSAFGFISRALPEFILTPARHARLEGEYFKHLSQEDKFPESDALDPRLLSELKSVGRIARRDMPAEKANPPPPTSLGACSEYTRKEGGYNRLIRDFYYDRDRNPDPNLPDAIPPKMLIRSVERGSANPNLFKNKLKALRAMATLPQSTHGIPVPIKEQGWKLRWVTKLPGRSQMALHRLRERIFPALKSFKESRIPLLPSFDSKTLYFGFESKKRSFYSLDMSKGTDSMSPRAYDFMLELLGVPKKSATGHSFLWSQPLTGKYGSVTPTFGAYMGNPLTWTIYSLNHLAILRATTKRRNTAFLKGDDVIAYWTAEEYTRYKSLCEPFGMSLNLSKTFHGKRRGMFCETMYYAQVINGRMYLKPTSCSESIRALTRFDTRWDWSKGRLRDEVAPWATQIGDVLHRYPHRVQNDLIRIFFTPLVQLCRAKGLDPFLPVQAGGLGLPPKNWLKPVSISDACLLTQIHNSRKGYSQPWRTLTASSPLSRALADRLCSFEESLEWYALGSTEKPLVEDIDEKLSPYVVALTQYYFAAGLETKVSQLTSTQFIKRLGSAVKVRKKAIPNSVRPLEWTYASAYELFKRFRPTVESFDSSWSKPIGSTLEEMCTTRNLCGFHIDREIPSVIELAGDQNVSTVALPRNVTDFGSYIDVCRGEFKTVFGWTFNRTRRRWAASIINALWDAGYPLREARITCRDIAIRRRYAIAHSLTYKPLSGSDSERLSQLAMPPHTQRLQQKAREEWGFLTPLTGRPKQKYSFGSGSFWWTGVRHRAPGRVVEDVRPYVIGNPHWDLYDRVPSFPMDFGNDGDASGLYPGRPSVFQRNHTRYYPFGQLEAGRLSAFFGEIPYPIPELTERLLLAMEDPEFADLLRLVARTRNSQLLETSVYLDEQYSLQGPEVLMTVIAIAAILPPAPNRGGRRRGRR